MSNSIVRLPSLPSRMTIDATQGVAGALNSGGRHSSAGTATPARQSSDRTELSTQGQILGDAVRSLTTMSTFRHDVVAGLKAKISAGQYKPDAARVAGAIARAIGSRNT